MERPSSVPCMSLPRPPSPYSGKIPQNSSEEASKFVSLQHVADMKKENFSLKLKIYYLETTLSKVSGAEKFDVLNENVQLKVENESIMKELSTNKELLIKASSLVDSLSTNQGVSQDEAALAEENNELQKLISNLEQELLKSRQDAEEQASEVDHLHAECMLLQDQVHLKDMDLKERQVALNTTSDNDSLQAQLAAQEHLYRTDTEELKRELEELRGVMIKTHEENVGHRLALAEKDDIIRELKVTSDDEVGNGEESRASLLEALSEYAANNARLDGELASMESNTTELQNVINSLNTEREELIEQLGEQAFLQQTIADYEHEVTQMKQALHGQSPKSDVEMDSLVEELNSAREEVEELKHSLGQAKLTTDISQHEAAILRGNIEETEQQKQEEKHIIKSLKQNLERLSKESADVSKENSIIQEENEMLREKVQDLNKEVSDLKETAKGLQTQNNNSDLCKINEQNEEILSLKQSLADANEDIKYCKEDFKSLELEYEKVSEELELAEEDLRQAQLKKVSLTDALDELREQFLKFKSQVNDEKKMWKAKKNLESDEMTNARDREKELLEDEIKKINSEKDMALEKIKNIERDNHNLMEQRKELDSKLSQFEKQVGQSVDIAADNIGISPHMTTSISTPLTSGDSAYVTVADSYQTITAAQQGQCYSDLSTLEAQRSYLIQRIDELKDTKRSLEDSLLSLKDQLSSTPLPNSLFIEDTVSINGVKDEVIKDLKTERDNYRDQRKELENELRRIHELLHDVIRQLHRYHSNNSHPLQLTSSEDDYLLDSLKGAVELVINSYYPTDDLYHDTSLKQNIEASDMKGNNFYSHKAGNLQNNHTMKVGNLQNNLKSRDNATMTSFEVTCNSSTQTKKNSIEQIPGHFPTQDSNIVTEEREGFCRNCSQNISRAVFSTYNQFDSSLESMRHSPHLDLSSSSSTIKLTDFILLCANNWLDELPELMRALRDAIHSSIVDCQSVQTRVKERRATWVDCEVGRLSARLDAVYRLLQHVENLSVQQPPSKIVHTLRQDVHLKDKELHLLNDKLLKRTRDINKLRLKVEEQDRQRIKQKIARHNLSGLNPSILCKVMDTESVLREAHKSLEKRMVAKEMD